MNYLARLRQSVLEKRVSSEPTEPTQGPSVSSVSSLGGAFPEIEDADLAERVAIMVHDGGLPDLHGEALARLDMFPPAGIEAPSWHAAIDTVALLLDEAASSTEIRTLPVSGRIDGLTV
jgi:hypothetical protein